MFTQQSKSHTTNGNFNRVLSFEAASNDLHNLFAPLVETYATAYQTLTEAKQISCVVTGTVFDTVSPPNIIILDVRRKLPFTIVILLNCFQIASVVLGLCVRSTSSNPCYHRSVCPNCIVGDRTRRLNYPPF